MNKDTIQKRIEDNFEKLKYEQISELLLTAKIRSGSNERLLQILSLLVNRETGQIEKISNCVEPVAHDKQELIYLNHYIDSAGGGSLEYDDLNKELNLSREAEIILIQSLKQANKFNTEEI